MAKIRVVCRACNGSGVYSGSKEDDGVGVICRNCAGEGFSEREEFTGKVVRSDIQSIKLASGVLVDYDKFRQLMENKSNPVINPAVTNPVPSFVTPSDNGLVSD